MQDAGRHALVEERQTRPVESREARVALGVRLPPGALWKVTGNRLQGTATECLNADSSAVPCPL